MVASENARTGRFRVDGPPASPPRVYLIDASIYVFRGWHVLPDDIVDGDGAPANAVCGFADFLARFLAASGASHVGVCFDTSLAASPRRALYAPYKAHRPPAPPALRAQFGHCRALTRAAGLAEFAREPFEADDVLATLAAAADAAGHPVSVVSGDKDLTQIVTGAGDWWDFGQGRRLDAAGIRKRFGVPPAAIADLLALAGDRSDNIPGIPGIGRRPRPACWRAGATSTPCSPTSTAWQGCDSAGPRGSPACSPSTRPPRGWRAA